MKDEKLWYSTCHRSRQSCWVILCGVERIELVCAFSSFHGVLKLFRFPLGLQLQRARTVVLVGHYSEWLPCCPGFQIFLFPSLTSAFFPEFLLCGQSILCCVMTVISIGMTESLMTLMQTVTSGGCFAFIYLFTYGKQVANSIGHFFFMQSVLLLHCPPTSISAGDFKLSLAFIETEKTAHLFLLLSHFTACASCFWHLGPLVREASVVVKSCSVWLCCTRHWGEEQFASPLCVGGQQNQHEWHWARLMGRVCLQDELMLVKCWYLSLPASQATWATCQELFCWA